MYMSISVYVYTCIIRRASLMLGGAYLKCLVAWFWQLCAVVICGFGPRPIEWALPGIAIVLAHNWTPKVCKIMDQNLYKQPKRLLLCILWGGPVGGLN